MKKDRTDIYADVDPRWLRKQREMVGDGGGGGGPIWQQALPRTVAEVKRYSTVHTEFMNRSVPDDFAFKIWCVLIPKPSPDDPNTRADASRVLIENRQWLGNSLADDVLLLTMTKEGGAVDFGFAADVKRALEYNDDELPALLFIREPDLRIYPYYRNEEILKLKNCPLNGLAMTLGGHSIDTVRMFLERLPALLEGGNVPVDELSKLLKTSESAAKRAHLAQAGKKAAGAAAETVPTLLTIISSILKWTGHA